MSEAVHRRRSKETKEKSRIRVFIIHEHAIVREGLRMLLETYDAFEVVGDAKACEEAFESVQRGDVDIVLLDTDLRAPNCVESLSNLMSLSTKTRILVMTGASDPELFRNAIECGAAGLFLKDHRCETLVKAIEKVAEGEVWVDRSMMGAVLLDLRRKKPERDAVMNKIGSLTAREREIIGLICQGLRNREIGDRLFIGEKTVRNHLASIFSKLHVEHRLELSVYARKHGLDGPSA